MTQRQEQIKGELQKLAGDFINNESNRDSLVTVTRADVSPNFSAATIYITVMPEEKEKDVIHFLMRRGRDFRTFVIKKTNMKRTPFFDFKIDEGEKNRRRIDELLQE